MSDKPQEAKESKIHIVTAFVVAAVIIAVICVTLPKQLSGGTTNGQTDAAASDAQTSEGNASNEADAAFPSWNANSASLAEVKSFVEDVTNPESPNYVEPADRIATFDMDGTILCEKAPVYFDYCLTMHRVLDDPTFNADEGERFMMQQIRDHANTYGDTDSEYKSEKHRQVASAFAGMTPEEFRAYTVNFADNTQAVGFEGMTYGQSFYKPMLEVINYLRDNEFDVWIVSACEREVTRAMVDRLGIPADHVIATDVPYVSSNQGEEAASDHTMSQDETMVLGEPLQDKAEKTGKCAAIAREIGKYPLIAFGNSSGDHAMLNYAKSNPHHKGMGVYIVADDEAREYGNAQKAAEANQTAAENNWTAVSMKDDWATIYGEGVQKTALPNAAAAESQTEEEGASEEETPYEEYIEEYNEYDMAA